MGKRKNENQQMVVTYILKVKAFTLMEDILRLEESCETSVGKRRI